jgi:hypothetical protein
MGADHNNQLSDDLLTGIEEIADFLKVPYHRAQRIIATKQIPAGKLGGILIGSKRRITAAVDRITSGEAA